MTVSLSAGCAFSKRRDVIGEAVHSTAPRRAESKEPPASASSGGDARGVNCAHWVVLPVR